MSYTVPAPAPSAQPPFPRALRAALQTLVVLSLVASGCALAWDEARSEAPAGRGSPGDHRPQASPGHSSEPSGAPPPQDVPRHQDPPRAASSAPHSPLEQGPEQAEASPPPHTPRPADPGDRDAADELTRTLSHDVTAVLDEVAAEFGWRTATIRAIAWVESRWTQEAISPKGAIGVMQVRPATSEQISDYLDQPLDLYDLRDNVTAGVLYLDILYDRFDGNFRAALAAYHQGPTRLRQDGLLPVSARYVDEVLAVRDQFMQ